MWHNLALKIFQKKTSNLQPTNNHKSRQAFYCNLSSIGLSAQKLLYLCSCIANWHYKKRIKETYQNKWILNTML
jgi:hypothetical protein